MLRRAGALLVLGAAGLGCGGGIGPGDYVFFRVAFTQQEKESGLCLDEDGVPTNDTNDKLDKTDFRSSSLFLIYGAVEDQEEKLYLDTGTVTLEGYEEAGLYTFTATSTDVNFTEINGGGDKHTFTKKLLVEMTIDGTSVVGTSEMTEKKACTGSTCALTLPVTVNCAKTRTFVGTEIEEIELHHDID
jgi:hypothetical protein